MTPGYFVFLFRLQLEAEVEKEPAGFHNNTSWNWGGEKDVFYVSLSVHKLGKGD